MIFRHEQDCLLMNGMSPEEDDEECFDIEDIPEVLREDCSSLPWIDMTNLAVVYPELIPNG